MSLFLKILRNSMLKCMLMTAFMQASTTSKRLGFIEGYNGKKNEVIYHPSISQVSLGTVAYFGGDIQDYSEEMLSHRDNKHHIKWNLEDTAQLLHERFPDWEIVIVKPSKMSLKTFSCYENFMEVNNFGAPTHKISIDALLQLKLLLQNVQLQTLLDSPKPVSNTSENCQNNKDTKPVSPLIIIGFSKGCVVLNQLLYAFHALHTDSNEDLLSFVKQIKTMYWLEGGHSGMSNTWITNKDILQTLASMNISIKIHVTPYQVFCESRPRIGKEEKLFRETLRKMGADVERYLHFEEEPRSLDTHFRVLEVFEKPY